VNALLAGPAAVRAPPPSRDTRPSRTVSWVARRCAAASRGGVGRAAGAGAGLFGGRPPPQCWRRARWRARGCPTHPRGRGRRGRCGWPRGGASGPALAAAAAGATAGRGTATCARAGADRGGGGGASRGAPAGGRRAAPRLAGPRGAPPPSSGSPTVLHVASTPALPRRSPVVPVGAGADPRRGGSPRPGGGRGDRTAARVALPRGGGRCARGDGALRAALPVRRARGGARGGLDGNPPTGGRSPPGPQRPGRPLSRATPRHRR